MPRRTKIRHTLETFLALEGPTGVPPAERLTGDSRLGRDVADRAAGVDPLAQATASLGGERRVRVKHRASSRPCAVLTPHIFGRGEALLRQRSAFRVTNLIEQNN